MAEAAIAHGYLSALKLAQQGAAPISDATLGKALQHIYFTPERVQIFV